MDSIARLLLYSAGIILILLEFTLGFSIIMRYLFNDPVPGIVQITTTYYMIGFVFIYMGYLHRKDGNVAVTVFSSKLGALPNELIAIGYNILTLIVFALIAFVAYQETMDLWAVKATTIGTVELPTYVSWGLMTVGLIAFCVFIVERLVVACYELVQHLSSGTESGQAR